MKIIKKINNNVVKCIDNKGNYLIAIGKGLGFPKVPYILSDLSKIDATFYKLNNYFEKLILELPEQILILSINIINYAQKELFGNLNYTLIFSLADHIQFTLQRLKNYQDIKFLLTNEIVQLYPKEIKVATEAVKMINETMNVKLPQSEITAIALHFINNQFEFKISREELLVEHMIEEIFKIIEENLKIKIDFEEFNSNRFKIHIRYYLKRMRKNEQFIDENNNILNILKETKPEVYSVTDKIGNYIYQEMGIKPTKEEFFYLMIHINRLYEKIEENDKNG